MTVTTPTTETGIVELLACPFCGGQPRGPIEQRNGQWRIYCCGFYREAPAEHLAIAAWNTRAAIAAMPDSTQLDAACPRCAAHDRDWWKPEPEDPFWMLEAEDGEWLKNRDSLLGTRDATKAIRFPTERDAYECPARMATGSKWWSAKPTEHAWVEFPPAPDSTQLLQTMAGALEGARSILIEAASERQPLFCGTRFWRARAAIANVAFRLDEVLAQFRAQGQRS